MSYTLKYTGSEIDDILDRAVAGGEIDTELAGKQDTLTFDDAPEAGSDNPVKSGGIFDAIKNATVLNAYQLLGSQYALDKTPYTYRQTGGGVSVGNRLKDKIVGASIGWNQTYKPAGTAGTYLGLTVTANADESTTISGTSNATGNIGLQVNNNPSYPSVYTKDHIYALYGMPSGVTGARINRYIGTQLNDYGNGGIRKATASGTTSDAVRVVIENNNQAYNFTVRPQFVDLTLMLGSAIAEKALEKDLAVAGSGIAWLRSYGLLSSGYHAYDAGSIKSVNVSAHKTVGKNLLNPDIAAWGTNATYRYINNVVPFKDTAARMTLTDKDTSISTSGVYIGFVQNDLSASTPSNYTWIVNNGTLTGNSGNLSNSAYCQNVFIYPNTADAFNRIFARWNVQVEFGSTATAYEPYEAHTYALNPNGELRGVLKLDGSNNLYADGDVYTADGGVAVKYGIVDLGTLDYTYSSGTGMMVSTISGASSSVSVSGNALCARYENGGSVSNWDDAVDKHFYLYSNGTFRIKDLSYTDAASFKTAMSGVYLVYELATPTSRSADPFQEIQICADGGTEEYTQTFNVPVGHETEYLRDLVGAIEDIPEAPSADGTYTLQVVVSGGVATYGWASGGMMLSMSAPDIQRAQNVADILTDELEAEEPAEEAEEPTEEAEEE